MSRTNVDVDDQLVSLVMSRYGVTTKREAIDLALRELVGRALTPDEALKLEGSGWAGISKRCERTTCRHRDSRRYIGLDRIFARNRHPWSPAGA